MGPKRGSLSHVRRALPCAAALATLACAAGFAAAQDETPARTIPFTEQKEVRRVQIDVSVIDPRGDDLASTPGLTRDMFELRLDGVPLTPEEMGRVEFDEICSAGEPDGSSGGAAGSPDDRPTLIAFIDLNFLDVRMRHGAARALADLSELAGRRPLRVKVIAYTRQLIPLTEDFTSDPEAIARAGRALLKVDAIPPPLGALTAAPQRLDPGAPIDSRPLSEQTDSSAPLDPNREIPAFRVQVPDSFSLLDETGRFRFTTGQEGEVFLRDVDPRPSLAALEAVLLSHSAIRGRKALVVFSSSWFDLPESAWLTYIVGPRQAAQGGFTIWAVDARGLAGGLGGHVSGVLKYLTASTGGDLVRSAGRLAIAFERALSQLSCYYLFTIPIPAPSAGEKEHAVDVRIDTRKHPEFWRYRVRTVSGVTLLSSPRLRERRRLAGLMEPEAHRLPEVRVTASYPTGDEQPATVVEIASLLGDFTYGPAENGGFVARFALEGVVTEKSGRTVCRLGDGQERQVLVAEQPARFPPSLLVVRTRCALPAPGVYDVRAIVEDLTTQDIGAAHARLEYAPLEPGLARVSALRLGRNTGRDFLLDLPGPRAQEIGRDQARRAFIPLQPGEGILPQDRLLLRFVACNSPAPPRVILYRTSAEAAPEPEDPDGAPRALFEALVAHRGGQRGETSSCSEFEAVVPEATLRPGDYGLMLIEPPAPEQGESLPTSRALGAVEFRVGTPPPPPAETPSRQARTGGDLTAGAGRGGA